MLGTCATVPLVTTSSDCNNAQSSVAQMNSIFSSLGSPSQYQAQITAINSAIQSAVSWYSTFGMCSTAFNIGIQADTLTNQMLSDAGQSGVTGPTCGDVAPVSIAGILGGGTTSSFLGGLGVGALAIGGVILYLVTKK